MKTVEVSESALESLKAMVEQLQGERDELLNALKTAEAILYGHQKPIDPQITKTITKFTQTQSICDWQERMNG